MSFIDYLDSHYSYKSASGGSQLKLDGPCPFCGENRRDLRLYVNPKEEIGICHHCGRGFRAPAFIMAAEGCDLGQALAILNNDDRYLSLDENDETQEAATPWPEMVPIDTAPQALGYLLERNITKQMIEQHGLGFAPYDMEFNDMVYGTANRVIIPIYDLEGKPVSWQGRTIIRGVSPKYLFPPGFKGSSYLYNANNIPVGAPYIIMTEGTFHVYGWQRFGITNTVGTFGKKISEEQIDILRYLRPQLLINAWDSDAKWLKYEFVEKHGYKFPKTLLLDLDGKDSDEVTRGEAFAAIRAAKPYSWEDKILSKVC